MIDLKFYIVNAFTDELFKGNLAGVCLLENWISDDIMQKIANENNLSETAFLVKKNKGYELRWFTPECEIDLCGHATLASAYILFSFFEKQKSSLAFETRSGVLTVAKADSKLAMDFPSRKPAPTPVPNGLDVALGAKILETHLSRDLIVLLKSEEVVQNLAPNFELLKKYKDYFGIVVTAKGTSCDFVSRYFAPAAGINEDPVTGSSHSTLIPFWSERLDKKELFAKQLSKRGGCLYCKDCRERVEIIGEAVLYMAGEIYI